MNHFAYSLRYVLKPRWSNVAKIISLSLGLAVGLVLFSMVTFHLSFDNFFPDNDRVYQLCDRDPSNASKNVNDMHYSTIAPALKEKVAGVESATRLKDGWEITYQYNGQSFKGATMFGDSLLFDVLDFSLVSGNARKDLAVADNILVSQSFAKRIFGEQDPVGKVLTFYDEPMTVVGVFKDVPKNCHLSFDVIQSFPNIEGRLGESFFTYVKLAKGVSPSDIEANLPELYKSIGLEEYLKKRGRTLFLRPIKTIHSDLDSTGRICAMLSILAVVILLIAALNVVLLSLASLADRARTMGVHKCNGARSGDIFYMILVEAGIFTVLSCLVAVGLLLAFGAQVEQQTGQSLSTLFAWSRLWVAALVVAAFFLLSGLAPARVFALVPVTAAFRGSASGKRTWKRVLLFFQLAAAVFIVCFLTVILCQYRLFMSKDLGYKPDNVLYANIPGATNELLSTLQTELRSMPEVEEAGVVFDLFSSNVMGLSGDKFYDVGSREPLFFGKSTYMDSHAIFLLEIKIVAGENFTERMGKRHVMVNRKYVELMHWTDSPIGKLVCVSAKPDTSNLMTIVGVVENFAIEGLQKKELPLLIYPYHSDYTPRSILLVKVNKLSPQTMEAVSAKLSKLLPTQELTVSSYRQTLASQYDEEKKFRNTVTVISLVILAIALIGIVGYVSYEMRRRSREMAIRKVHGASRWDVLKTVSADIRIIAAISVTVGIAMAYYVSEVWLRQFAHKISLSAWIFVVGGLLVLLAVAVTVLIQTRRIVNENPVESIKTE